MKMKYIFEVLTNHTQGDVSALFVHDRFNMKSNIIINRLYKEIGLDFLDKNLYLLYVYQCEYVNDVVKRPCFHRYTYTHEKRGNKNLSAYKGNLLSFLF